MTLDSVNSMGTSSVQVTPVRAVEATAPAVDAVSADAAQSSAPQSDALKSPVKPAAESGKPADSATKDPKDKTEKIKKAVDSLNKEMKHSEAIFGIHEGTDRVTIKIIDRDTKEVIREVPPEETLDMIAKIWEMAGLLVDEKR